MIKNIVQFEAKIEEWIGHLHLPTGIPFAAAEQMLLQYLAMIGKMKEAQLAAQAAVQNTETPPVEQPAEPAEPEQPKAE